MTAKSPRPVERLRSQNATSSSVTRAFAILDAIALRRDPSATPQELAKQLRMSKSTTHRYLLTLDKLGAVERDAHSGYRLGLKLIELAGTTLSNSDLRTQADPLMSELAERAEETVHLAVPSGRDVVYIAKADSARAIRMYSYIGTRAPMYCTALGKAILAFSEPRLLEQVIGAGLAGQTAHSITAPERLRREIERVRAEGFALDNQENETGVCCVGAPVFDYTGKPIGALSISGPAERMSRARQLELGHLVQDAARRLSRRMGFFQRNENQAIEKGGMRVSEQPRSRMSNRRSPDKLVKEEKHE